MTNAVPDRTGQVWSWHGRLILVISGPDPDGRHCNRLAMEHMHPVAFLEHYCELDGLYEKPSEPWEQCQWVERIA